MENQIEKDESSEQPVFNFEDYRHVVTNARDIESQGDLWEIQHHSP